MICLKRIISGLAALTVLALQTSLLLPPQLTPASTPAPDRYMAAHPLTPPATSQGAIMAVEATPTPQPTPTPEPAAIMPARPHHAPNLTITNGKLELLLAAGIPSDVFNCADILITRESGWRVDATNPTSGAYGLPQSLPAEKLASAGADWRTNPVTQLRWQYSYVLARYGGYCQALDHSNAYGWY